jgi:hypothetical protein
VSTAARVWASGNSVAEPVGQRVQARLDQLVVVVAERVARDAPVAGASSVGGRLERDVVVHRDADDALRAGEIRRRVGALVEAVVQVAIEPAWPSSSHRRK